MSSAITCGDPAGIGPEVALRAVLETPTSEGERRLLFGPRAAWEAAARLMGRTDALAGLEIIDTGPFEPALVFCGRSDAATGLAGFQALERAVDEILAGNVDAIVTAPIDKSAWAAAGLPWKGHTGYLAERAGLAPGQVLMSFIAGDSLIGLATEHRPLARVPEALTTEGLIDSIVLLERGLRVRDRWAAGQGSRRDGLERPRIAVCGLNPHAGESGLLGTEDAEIIAPAVAAARARGIEASGPWPADGLFARLSGLRKRRGDEQPPFDGVLAMYHDQGLIPAKLLGGGRAVNWTLGLPFVRTSPDHGTACDLAGRGVADPSSMAEALRLAVRLGRGG